MDVIRVATWMFCGNGRSLSGRYHGRYASALWEWTESVWTLTWLAHGCFRTGRSLSGRYHGCHMDALDGFYLGVITVIMLILSLTRGRLGNGSRASTPAPPHPLLSPPQKKKAAKSGGGRGWVTTLL